MACNSCLSMHRKNNFTAVVCGLALLCLAGPAALAQDAFSDRYRDTANLFRAFDLTQLGVLQQIVSIGEDPATAPARGQLQQHLRLMQRMSMDEMMAMGLSHDGMAMQHDPYGSLETQARATLIGLLRQPHSSAEVSQAFAAADVLGTHAVRVLQHGRQFEDRLFAIYADASIERKDRAVDAAVQEYLVDSRHAVPALPKSYSLLGSHAQAGAFQTAFPRFSGLLWSAQWLQLATLEGLMVEYVDHQFSDTLPEIEQRFWNKVGSASGMSMFPPPNELPMAPTIAPHLYLLHPAAAVIVDNLNMLETVIADILAWPDLANREEAIDAAVATFTDKESNIDMEYDYLLAVLRGGIYNQGGPAIGDLDRSERNRSRMEMQMNHGVSMRPGFVRN